MRLIDADKIDFGKVFLGESDFAKDTRNAAQDLITRQPTAYDVENVIRMIEDAKEDNPFTGMAIRCAYEVGINCALDCVKAGVVNKDLVEASNEIK